MSALSNLQERLRVMGRGIAEIRHWGNPEAMRTVHREIQKHFGGLTAVTNQAAIEDSVLAFRHLGILQKFREAKYVCFGCASSWGDDDFRLIEHGSLFKYLLDHVRSYHQEPRRFSICYQGLLLGYLSYPVFQTESEQGKRNWNLLREFLDSGVSVLTTIQPATTWAMAVSNHSNLFGESPCRKYAEQMLQGDNREFDEMVEAFGLSGRMTWVHELVLLSQIESACDKSDREFLPLIELILDALERLQDLKPLMYKGLGMVLTRYKKCADPVEHPKLRDLALAEWKNPWLAVNQSRWLAWVDQPVRAMVTNWMKARYIQDFFNLLQADGTADQRRLAFWLQYVEQIEDMYFALGTSAYFSRNPDYKALRERMSGRRMKLESGSHDNNAFLMVIGGYLFIEFGERNNACYVFENGEGLPFQLGQASVADNQNGLKNRGSSAFKERLFHTDGNQRWERKFRDRIARLTTGYRPNQNARVAAAENPAPAPEQPRLSQKVTMEELEKFATANNLRIVDGREDGGYLWVYPNGYVGATVDYALKYWGFRHSAKRNGWYLE